MEVLDNVSVVGLRSIPQDALYSLRPRAPSCTLADCKAPPFDFLGFTHTMGRNRNKGRTCGGTNRQEPLARALMAIKTGVGKPPAAAGVPAAHVCREARRAITPTTITGTSRNSPVLRADQQVVRKWLARRRVPWGVLTWEPLQRVLTRHTLPTPVVHHYAGAQPSSPLKNRIGKSARPALWGRGCNILPTRPLHAWAIVRCIATIGTHRARAGHPRQVNKHRLTPFRWCGFAIALPYIAALQLYLDRSDGGEREGTQ